jgi:hypothetical protein
VAAAAAVLLVMGVAGCSGEAGAAGIVGDERITVEEIQQEAEAFASEVLGESTVTDAAAVQRVILQNRIYHELHLELAERAGIEVTGADIDRLLAVVAAQSGGTLEGIQRQGALTDEAVRDVAYDIVVREQAVRTFGSPDGVAVALIELDAEIEPWVNPRYGTWADTSLQPGTGSISRPAAESLAP